MKNVFSYHWACYIGYKRQITIMTHRLDAFAERLASRMVFSEKKALVKLELPISICRSRMGKKNKKTYFKMGSSVRSGLAIDRIFRMSHRSTLARSHKNFSFITCFHVFKVNNLIIHPNYQLYPSFNCQINLPKERPPSISVDPNRAANQISSPNPPREKNRLRSKKRGGGRGPGYLPPPFDRKA